jgi:signal peptidase II
VRSTAQAAATAAVVLVLDQVTKVVALDGLAPGVPIDIVDGFFSLTLVMNPGLAFGLLSGTPASWRWIVALLSMGALAVLGVIGLRLLAEGGWPARFALGLVFGGAIGNLIDRARFGAVVDFLDFYWRGYHWPAFNVADSAITVGVLVLALHLLWSSPAPAVDARRDGAEAASRRD